METRKILTLIHQLMYYYKEKKLKESDVFGSNEKIYIEYLDYVYVFKKMIVNDYDNVSVVLSFEDETIDVNIDKLDYESLKKIYKVVFINLMKIIREEKYQSF